MTISDAGGTRAVTGAVVATPGGNLRSVPVGVEVQDDARRFAWTGPAAVSIDGPAADLRAKVAADQALSIRLRLDRTASAGVTLELGDAALEIGSVLASQALGEPATMSVPLRCFAAAGADMATVRNAVRIKGDAGLEMTLIEAKLAPVNQGAACPPSKQ